MASWLSSLFFRPSVWTRIKNEGRSLQCHLDVNGVILGQETIGDQLTPTGEYASIMLANGTYSQWTLGQESKSYKAHVWENLHPGPNNDSSLRKTRKEALRQFVTALITHKHPLAEKVNRQYQKLVSILQNSPIFPGFPNLIRTLRENNISHNFIFRTFGGDGELIKKYLAEAFPEMYLQQGRFDEDATFHYQKEGREVVIKDPNEFRELIKVGHWLIQDNFERWRKGQEQGNYGKLFLFSSDPQDRVLSIFADDNLEIVSGGEQRTIVCCYDSARNALVSTQQASSHLIKINPIEAALDSNYLTARVAKTAEQLLIPSQNKLSFLKVAVASTVLTAGLLAYAFSPRTHVYT